MLKISYLCRNPTLVQLAIQLFWKLYQFEIQRNVDNFVDNFFPIFLVISEKHTTFAA